MIKRCNDFGAGGVSVAIGELADGLHIDLNKVTKKYDGLDGTELAISESQERMAVPCRRGRGRVHRLRPRGKPGSHPWPPSPRKRDAHGLERQGHRGPVPRVPELQRCRAPAVHILPGHAPMAAPVGRFHLWPKRWNILVRPERCAPEGPGRAVRLHHRRGHRADALRRQAPADPRHGHGCQSCRWTARPPPAPAWPGASTPT